MAETLSINPTSSKSEKYEALLPQIQALISDEDDLTANLANIASALKYGMDFFWVGFYQVKKGVLVLAPFQGPIACSRIAFGAGVCGTAYVRKQTLIVADVADFEGHIACSSESKSEIVVPIFKGEQVVMVLDVDSDRFNDFDQTDKKYLEQLAQMIAQIYPESAN